jgi:hypothetical protein
VGGRLVRLLPNIDSLDRAKVLADGGAPTDAERPIAEQLVRAARLRAMLSTSAPAERGAPTATPRPSPIAKRAS